MGVVTVRIATDEDSVEVAWEADDEAAEYCAEAARLIRQEGANGAMCELVAVAVLAGRTVRRGGL